MPLLVLVCASIPALAQDQTYQLGNGWQGEVKLTPKRLLRHCGVSRFVFGGTSLSLAAYPQGHLSILLYRKDWTLSENAARRSIVRVDRSLLVGTGTLGGISGFLRFVVDDVRQALHEISEGDRLALVIGDREFQVDLTGSRRAVQFLLDCARKYGGVEMAARFSRETTDEAPAARKESGPGDNERRSRSGTAFYVSADGLLITNAHVVAGCSEVAVTAPAVAKGSGRVVARDATNDLALLATSMRPNIWARFRGHVRLGESVFAFGFPFSGYLSTSGNFTSGNVTAETGPRDDARILQVSAPVQAGNSGGPLLDQSGQVVGVVVAKLNALVAAAVLKDIPQNVNFAIKSSVAEVFLQTHGVRHTMDQDGVKAIPPADVAEIGKGISVAVECRPR